MAECKDAEAGKSSLKVLLNHMIMLILTVSLQWLDACLDLHATHSLEGVSGMLAPVGGGSSASERSRAAQQVADKPVTGVCS